MDSTLPLYRFDADAADVFREFVSQVRYIIESNELDIGHHRCERRTVLLFVRRGDGTHGAPMKTVLERKELLAEILTTNERIRLSEHYATTGDEIRRSENSEATPCLTRRVQVRMSRMPPEGARPLPNSAD